MSVQFDLTDVEEGTSEKVKEHSFKDDGIFFRSVLGPSLRPSYRPTDCYRTPELSSKYILTLSLHDRYSMSTQVSTPLSQVV